VGDAHALVALPSSAQHGGDVHAPRPRAEILGADFAAGDLLQVIVHVGRADRLHLARFVLVLEQLLPRQVPAAAHDARELRVVHGDAVELAALAAELEFHARAAHLHVAVAHGGEAEGVVLLGIALVADANRGALEEPHDERQHLAARQPGKGDVGARLAADARQRLGEFHQMVELVGVAHLSPARVVAVLLAAARVAARDLEMSALVAADPHVGPRGRNHEEPDALERRLVGDAPAFRVEVLERLAAGLAHVALLAVARIAQSAGRAGSLAGAALGGGRTSRHVVLIPC